MAARGGCHMILNEEVLDILFDSDISGDSGDGSNYWGQSSQDESCPNKSLVSSSAKREKMEEWI